MVLSDISFDRRAPGGADSGGAAGDVFGREGEHVLVNGRKAPVLRVRSGAPQRWRIVNTARSRYFLLDLQGQKFTVIGTDGGCRSAHHERGATHNAGRTRDVIVAPTGAPGRSCRSTRCSTTAATAAWSTAASRRC
jgi:FtsP/CotA-like multicopper oxidase with cupredoxin domain